MTLAEIIEQVSSLTFEERQTLVQQVIDLDDPPLAGADESLVEQRLARHRSDPGSSIPLDEFKRRLLAYKSR